MVKVKSVGKDIVVVAVLSSFVSCFFLFLQLQGKQSVHDLGLMISSYYFEFEIVSDGDVWEMVSRRRHGLFEG